MRSLFTSGFLLFVLLSHSQDGSLNKYLKAEWKRVDAGNGFSISSPFDMESTDITAQLPDEVKKMIEKMSTVAVATKYGIGALFTIYITAVTYVPSVTVSLPGAMEGSKNNLANTGIENLVCNTVDANEFGLKGLKMECSYLKSGTEYIYDSYAYGNGNKMWMMVMISRKAESKDAKELMKRVHDSIKFQSQQ